MKHTFYLLWLLMGCSHVFYQPTKPHFLDPAKFKVQYHNINFFSQDGTKLHGWFIPATSNPRGTIVQFHGNAQNISTHFLSLLWLTHQGYNLFTFDYRGYGKSEGEPNQELVHQDSLSALTKGWELHEKYAQGGKFITYGQSLGGNILLRALMDFPQKEVSLLVLDSTFASYQGIAFDKLTSRWFLALFSPLAYFLVSDAYAPEKYLAKISPHTLVIVGQKDPIIPAKFGKRIYKKLSAPKWLWKLPEGHHIDVFHGPNEGYRLEFLRLIDGISQT